MDLEKRKDSNKMKKSYSSLENALRLLELFSVEESDFSIKEIARRLSIADSTAHRLLSTMQNEGFISKDSIHNTYRLGVSIRALETVLTKDMDIYKLSTPILSSLTRKTNQAASLCILHEDEVFYLNTAEPDQFIYQELTYVGKSVSILSTSAGRVLISSKLEEEIKEFISNIVPFEQADQDQFNQADLLHINNKGYAISHNNFNSGLTSIAVPIKREKDQIIAAIELIGPDQHFKEPAVTAFLNELKKATNQMEESLKRNR